MIGNIRWNLAVGLLGFGLTFLLSVGNNAMLTTLEHSFYSFVLLFAAVFAFRWILGTFGDFAGTELFVPQANADGMESGSRLDLRTPDDDEHMKEMLRNGIQPGRDDSSFAPLNPPKLVTKADVPEGDMVKALRQMSEE